MNEIVICVENLSFSYKKDKNLILKKINFNAYAGETVAIVGASGSGKSTFLHLLAGLDQPTNGKIWLKNQLISDTKDHQRAKIRNQFMGFVYQFHHLLAEFSALENVAMPLLIAGEKRKVAYQKAKELLNAVGLSQRINHLPHQLSGGERQRTAIARSLINNPICLLADEPTGNLDSQNAKNIFLLMQDLIKKLNGAMIVVTHDLEIAKQTDRCYLLKNSELITNK